LGCGGLFGIWIGKEGTKKASSSFLKKRTKKLLLIKEARAS
jgi:hypothetical protein